TIQRRLAWPLHKDDTLFQSGRPTGLNIYFLSYYSITSPSMSCVTLVFSLRANPFPLTTTLQSMPAY
ncbi:hypothetical protein V8E53_006904, partial [Lactarius tabidus]